MGEEEEEEEAMFWMDGWMDGAVRALNGGMARLDGSTTTAVIIPER